MIPSLSIGPRTLLNDYNHSATAIFLEVSNTKHCSRSRHATVPRNHERQCQRVSDISAFDVFVSTRSPKFAAYLAACLP